MNTTTISITTTPETKAEALAKKQGINLSKLLGEYLKKLVHAKQHQEEEPSDYFIKSIKESEADVKAGRVISFKSGEALDYISSLIKDEK